MTIECSQSVYSIVGSKCAKQEEYAYEECDCSDLGLR